MRKNIFLYIIAFIMLLEVFLFFNKSYRELTTFSELTNRHNTVHSIFQNLLRQINNAAILNPDLAPANNNIKGSNLFFTDSDLVIQQLELLKSTVRDSVNIKIAAALDTGIRSELSWLLKSNVPDSIINHKSPAHIASFQKIVSLIDEGIQRTVFLIDFRKRQLNEEINLVRIRMTFFIVLSAALLIYTTIGLFSQRSKRKIKEKELEIVFNRINDSVVSVDNNWRYTFLNDAAMATHPFSRKETIGKVIWDVHPGMKGTIFWDIYHQAMQTKKPIEVEDYYAPMCIWFFVKVYPSPDGLTIFYKDITENKKLEEKQVLFASIVNSSDDAILSKTLDGTITSWNHGAEKIFGYDENEIVGLNISTLIEPQLHYEEIEMMNKIRKGENIDHYETKRTRKDGKVIDVSLTISPIKDASFKVIGASKILRDITERKKAEAEILQLNTELDQKVLSRTAELLDSRNQLKQTLERVLFLASIADNIQDPVISTDYPEDNNPIITRWNKPAEELLEWKSEEVMGKRASEIFKTAFPNDTREQIFETLKAKGFWQGEVIYHTKSGVPVYVLSTISYLKNDEGAITGNLVLIRDITKRKKAEEALNKLNEELEQRVVDRTEIIKRSEKQYRHLFESNPMPMWVIDLENFKFLDVNEVAILHYGYSREEFLSMTAFDIRPGEFRDAFKNSDHAYKKINSNYNKGTWSHRKKDGTIIQAEVIGHEIIFEGKQARLILSNDVTEQKKAAAKLLSSEKRFRKLIENNYDIISLLDASFKVFYRSPSAARITGWSDEEMKNIDGTRNIHPDDLEAGKKLLTELMDTPGKPFYTMFRNKHKNGHYFWVEGVLTNMLHDEDIKAIVFNFHDVTERVEAQEKLVQSELRFRSLIENSAEGIAMTDEFSNIIYRSPATQKITGILLNENRLSLTHPDDLDTIKNRYAEVLKSPGVPIVFQGRFLHASGYYFWMEGTLTNLLHVDGVNAVVANYRDITERKKAEEALLRAEANYREIFDKANDGIYVHEIETGRVINVNHRATELTGFSKEELMTGDPHEFMTNHPGYTFEKALNYIQKAAAGEPQFFEWLGRCKDGSSCWFEMNIKRVIIGEQERILAFQRDINDRKKVEEQLIKSEKIYKTIASSIPGSVICLLDGDFRYLLIEGDLLDKLGYSKEDLLGKKAGDVLPAGIFTSVKNDFIKAFAGEIITNESIRGGYDTISRFIPLKDENNIVYAIMTVSIDVTELKNAQRNIIELNHSLEEKISKRTSQLEAVNKELEAFTYSVSHDLRAPLRAVNGYAQMLEEDYNKYFDNEGKRLLGVIKNNATRMGTLIDELLEFSRLGRKEIKRSFIDMNLLVKHVVEEMEQNAASHAKINVEDLHPVMGDHALMAHVLVNLISNAVKYSSNNSDPIIRISSKKENGELKFSIQDNGVGFDMTYVHKLFGVFQRLHSNEEFSGTGVGLAIVQRIINKHGGRVWATGELNKGAVFSFSIPDTNEFKILPS